jgi:hypothetical protein
VATGNFPEHDQTGLVSLLHVASRCMDAYHDEDGADAQEVGQREAGTWQTAWEGCYDHGRCIDRKGQEQGPPAKANKRWDVSSPVWWSGTG